MDSGMNSSMNGGMEECAEAGIDSSMREGGRNMRRGMNGEGMKDGTTRSMNSGMKRGVTFRPPAPGGGGGGGNSGMGSEGKGEGRQHKSNNNIG